MKIVVLHDQQLNTVLAALRYYQEQGMGEPANRSEAIHDIATNCNTEISLDAQEIDTLADEINIGTTPEKALAVLKENGLGFDACVEAFCAERDDRHLAFAKENLARKDLYFDDNAVTIKGDGVAFVMGWARVTDDDAGVGNEAIKDLLRHFRKVSQVEVDGQKVDTISLSEITGDPGNEVVLALWQNDDGKECSVKFTEKNLSEAIWVRYTLHLEDSEGEPTKIRFYDSIPVKV